MWRKVKECEVEVCGRIFRDSFRIKADVGASPVDDTARSRLFVAAACFRFDCVHRCKTAMRCVVLRRHEHLVRLLLCLATSGGRLHLETQRLLNFTEV